MNNRVHVDGGLGRNLWPSDKKKKNAIWKHWNAQAERIGRRLFRVLSIFLFSFFFFLFFFFVVYKYRITLRIRCIMRIHIRMILRTYEQFYTQVFFSWSWHLQKKNRSKRTMFSRYSIQQRDMIYNRKIGIWSERNIQNRDLLYAI